MKYFPSGGVAVVESEGSGAAILYVPTCDQHDSIWRGAPSRDVSLAKFNAQIHDTDMHRGAA